VWCASWWTYSNVCSMDIAGDVCVAEGSGRGVGRVTRLQKHTHAEAVWCEALTCSPFHETHLSLTPLGMAIFLLRSGGGWGRR
jgi:hypothetical protein